MTDEQTIQRLLATQRVPNYILRNKAESHSNDEVRAMAAELLALRNALANIMNISDEQDEWDAVGKFNQCRQIAIDALSD